MGAPRIYRKPPTKKQITDIRQKLKAGQHVKTIAKQTGISRHYVQRIKDGYEAREKKQQPSSAIIAAARIYSHGERGKAERSLESDDSILYLDEEIAEATRKIQEEGFVSWESNRRHAPWTAKERKARTVAGLRPVHATVPIISEIGISY